MKLAASGHLLKEADLDLSLLSHVKSAGVFTKSLKADVDAGQEVSGSSFRASELQMQKPCI